MCRAYDKYDPILFKKQGLIDIMVAFFDGARDAPHFAYGLIGPPSASSPHYHTLAVKVHRLNYIELTLFIARLSDKCRQSLSLVCITHCALCIAHCISLHKKITIKSLWVSTKISTFAPN